MEAGPDEEIFELDGYARAKDDGSGSLGMYLAYGPNRDGDWYEEDELRDLNAILNDRFGPQNDDVNQPQEDEGRYPTPIGNSYSAEFDNGVRVSYDPYDDRWLWLNEEAAIDLSEKIDEHFGDQDDETEDSDPVLFTKEDVLSQVTTGAMTVHEAIELYNFLNDEGFYDYQVEDDPFVQEKGREWSFEADGDVTEIPDDSDADGSNRVYHKDGSHTDDGSDDGESEIDPVEFQSELIERIAEKTVNPESSIASA